MQVQVLVDVPLSADNQFFTYFVPPALRQQAEPGKRVLVQLGEALHRGFVFHMEEGKDSDGQLKPILDVLDELPLLDKNMLELAQWLSDYYMAPLNRVVRAMYPALLDDPGKELVVSNDSTDPWEKDQLDSTVSHSWENQTKPEESKDLIDLLKSGKGRSQPRTWG